MAEQSLTSERLRELLSYDPETGVFLWKMDRGRNAKVGQIAGTTMLDGYTAIKIDGKSHKAHRLAVLYMTGRWPFSGVDHRDGTKSNQKWENLREATPAQNQQNKKTPKTNTSGHIGVWWHARRKKWQVGIRVDMKLHYIGYFAIFDDAVLAYKDARKRLSHFQPVSIQDAG